MKEIEQQLQVSFFDRTQLAFLQDGKVAVVPLKAITEEVRAGSLRPDSLYFDNTVSTAGQLQQAWPRQAKETWLSRYF